MPRRLLNLDQLVILGISQVSYPKYMNDKTLSESALTGFCRLMETFLVILVIISDSVYSVGASGKNISPS